MSTAERIETVKKPPTMEEIPTLEHSLSATEILSCRDMLGKRDELVATDAIKVDYNIIQQEHADELKDSMIGSNGKIKMGQLIPVLLRAKLGENDEMSSPHFVAQYF